MRRCSVLVLALALLGGCLQTGLGTGTGSGGARQAATDASADSATDAAGTPGQTGQMGQTGQTGQTGSGCLEDLQAGIVLCEQISLCPGVVVDPGLYPNCGFRPNAGSVLDMECLCAQSLCPIGVATSCAAATQLLQAQSSLAVCLQENEGRCVSLPGASANGSSPCASCAQQCGGTPACFQACGC
jgi:hypothetical protein